MRSILDDIRWLKEHPHFEFRPASINEFLEPEYLNIADKVRPGVKGVLNDIFGKTAQDNRISVVERAIMTGAIGIGKNFRPTEPILTPSGTKNIGDLQVGDKVIGRDGKPHKVTGVYPNKNIQYYRMTFCDGTSIDCGEGHLWQVEVDGRLGRTNRTLTTKKILDYGLRWNGDRKWRFFMPNVNPVDFTPADVKIPAYSWAVIFLYGVVLGDRLHILLKDDKIIQRVTEELSPWVTPGTFDGRFCFKRRDSGFGNRLWDEFENLDDDETNRKIDDRYKFGLASDRIEFLRGLMDASASKSSEKNPGYFRSTRDDLLLDIVHIVRSLGGYSRIIRRRETLRGGFFKISVYAHVILKEGAYWAFPELNRDPRKATAGAGKMSQRRIVSLEKIDVDDGVCISVDAEDHLYVTRDFIVTHNTTFASIALPYMAHWVLCLKDPQAYYNLLPGSRIAFMQMSTSEQQAREVIFGDIDARIKSSPWFNKHYPRDPRITRQIRFPKDIWIIPGDSAETTFEGYNILAGILDEADSHKVVKDKDYAQTGLETIENRIKSRYVDHSDPNREGHKGLLIVIGQMKSQFGFASRIYRQYKEDPRAVAVRMAIWESFGWDQYTVDGKRNSFWYDVKRKRMIDTSIASKVGQQDGLIIEVPKQYLYEFSVNPEKALKDLGGIPPGAADPFISQTIKLDDAVERWNVHHPGQVNPVESTTISPKIFPDFIPERPASRRTAHMDFAYSGKGDSAAIAVGHIKELVENSHGDLVPYIVIDILIRIRAIPGEQVLLSDIRAYIYQLMKTYNMRFHRVTMDGFNSIDTLQQFRKRKISAEYLSVDRSKEPYEALRDALYEDRIEFPALMSWTTYRSEVNADDKIDILRRELTALQDSGQKIDHPPGGSKDVADAVAGVVSTLMGDSTYRKGVPSQRRSASKRNDEPTNLNELFKDFETITGGSDPMLSQIGQVMIPNLSGMTTIDRLPRRFRPREE